MKLIVKAIDYFIDPLKILFMVFLYHAVKLILADNDTTILISGVLAVCAGLCFLSVSAIVDAIQESKK